MPQKEHLRILALSLLTAGCGETNATQGSTAHCPVGAEACPCTPGGSCDPGLICLSQVCVAEPATGGTSGGATLASSTSSECPVGAGQCPCTPGGSCDAGLVCENDTCVPMQPLEDLGVDDGVVACSAGDENDACLWGPEDCSIFGCSEGMDIVEAPDVGTISIFDLRSGAISEEVVFHLEGVMVVSPVGSGADGSRLAYIQEISGGPYSATAVGFYFDEAPNIVLKPGMILDISKGYYRDNDPLGTVVVRQLDLIELVGEASPPEPVPVDIFKLDTDPDYAMAHYGQAVLLENPSAKSAEECASEFSLENIARVSRAFTNEGTELAPDINLSSVAGILLPNEGSIFHAIAPRDCNEIHK